jgi:hypothetical protein
MLSDELKAKIRDSFIALKEDMDGFQVRGSQNKMWSYYDWVYCCFLPSVNTICGRIMIGLSLLSSISKKQYMVVLRLGLLLL